MLIAFTEVEVCMVSDSDAWVDNLARRMLRRRPRQCSAAKLMFVVSVTADLGDWKVLLNGISDDQVIVLTYRQVQLSGDRVVRRIARVIEGGGGGEKNTVLEIYKLWTSAAVAVAR